MHDGVDATQRDGARDGPGRGADLTYRQAIAAALHDEMADDPSVVLLGEEVAWAGGTFKTSEGLLERYGPNRVIDTPICENGFVGVALGMSVTGLRPIVEIMFSDFLPTAADAIANEVAKFRFMSGGQYSVPLTIRTIGGAAGLGPQHSSTGESFFLNTAGLRIVAPSTPRAAYALLRAAIRDDNPVIVCEHKGMFGTSGAIPRQLETLPPIGEAEIIRPGRDATVVATLLMVERACRAADRLAKDGIEVEVIDLQWIRPMDVGTVRESVRRTQRLIIVEEQPHAGGWGSALISTLSTTPPWSVPPRAVSMPDMPVPVSGPLQDAVVPSVDQIIEAVRASMSHPTPRMITARGVG